MRRIAPEEIYDSNVIALCIIIAIAIFYIDSLIPLGVAGGVPYVLVVLLALWSPRKRLPIFMAVAVTVLTILGYFTSPPGGELWKVLLNRFLAIFAIWTTAILAVQRTKLLEQRNNAIVELKVLEGLLPICASCKKIRDDEGNWNQMEVYIRDHSEAEFSHGICPDCKDKLYPQLKSNT